jgi:hypothetical protein
MAEIAAQKQRRRGPGKPFRAGQSGNPAGKPLGARNHVTRAAEVLLEGEAEALTRKAIEMALAGDATALRLCLDRVLPPRKGRPMRMALPPVTRAGDVTTALASVIDAMGAGAIAPEEAVTICGVIEAQRRAIETADLETRLRLIEQRLADEKS